MSLKYEGAGMQVRSVREREKEMKGGPEVRVGWEGKGWEMGSAESDYAFSWALASLKIDRTGTKRNEKIALLVSMRTTEQHRVMRS